MADLFCDSNGRTFTEEDLHESLVRVGAADCKTLFIHSDIMFGTPVKGFRRTELLETLYQAIVALNVSNVIIPSFTYSFCNHEDYDVLNSKTSMGSFNEYYRKKENRYRTLDPLLSLSVSENLKPLFQNVGEHSLGKGSGLDIVHQMENVKFLFLGADMAGCFTYVHYVEKILDVPYRFDMPFEGNVVDENGIVSRRTQYIHTQCAGVQLPDRYDYFEKDLLNKGKLKRTPYGDKFISCISEKDAYEEIVHNIEENKFYYLAKPYRDEDLVHQYTYDWTKSRITHC
ncbi:AAC(3) family N-acetyltransferase [uncultured Fibrobacter sp.]|uniref:AAC(3) family N-acetyltransferase n=1 Tax=uncultured Fibrobacter sp. TaxID=261512 RepID=UPI0025D47E63|nr:AAC(3) family N-acetyltransferase [uncultured Fibrobacter sp.]